MASGHSVRRRPLPRTLPFRRRFLNTPKRAFSGANGAPELLDGHRVHCDDAADSQRTARDCQSGWRNGNAGHVPASVQISVVSLSGEDQQLAVELSQSVLQLKGQAATRLGTTAASLRLMLNAAVLADHCTLEECGIENGSSVSVVRSLLPDGFDQMSQEKRAELLWRAAVSGDHNLTSLFIDAGVPLNEKGPAKPHCVDWLRQGPPLWEAAARGQTDVALALIGGKADANLGSDLDYGFKWTTPGSPLLVGARYGHEAIVRALLEASAEVESYGSWNQDIKCGRGKFRGPGGYPLGIATMYGHEGAVRALLEGGANTEKCCIFQLQGEGRLSGIGTSLFAAAALGHLEILKLLIAAGADTESLGVCIAGNADGEWAYAHAHLFDSQLRFSQAGEGAYFPCYRKMHRHIEDLHETPVEVAMRLDRSSIVDALIEASGREPRNP